jgi:hypothetical protein
MIENEWTKAIAEKNKEIADLRRQIDEFKKVAIDAAVTAYGEAYVEWAKVKQ